MKYIPEDDPLKKWMKETGREKAPLEFNSNVMEKIYALEAQSKQRLAYKPVISKKAWMIIGVITIIYSLYLYLFVPDQEGESLVKIPDYSFDTISLQLPDLFQFFTPQLLIFASVILLLMVLDRLVRREYI